MKNEERKSPGRIVAEAIAKAAGTQVIIIGPVKMVGTEEVNEYLRLIRKASESSNDNGLKIRYAA